MPRPPRPRPKPGVVLIACAMVLALFGCERPPSVEYGTVIKVTRKEMRLKPDGGLPYWTKRVVGCEPEDRYQAYNDKAACDL